MIVDERIRRWPRRLSGIYLLVGWSWIVVSDLFLFAPSGAPRLLVWGMVKALAFVAATALMLYSVVRWAVRSLLEERRLVDALVRSSPLAIAAIDREGTVTLWNPQAEALFGWRSEEVVGRRVPTIPPDRRDEFRALLARTLAGEVLRGIELSRLRRDGSIVHVDFTNAPLRDEAGEIIGAFAMFSDATERKKGEEHIRLLVAALESAATAIALTAADGRPLWHNAAFERLMGNLQRPAPPEEAWGFLSGLPVAEREALQDAVAAGRSHRCRLIESTANGTALLAELRALPLVDDAGVVGHVVVTIEDQTERVQLTEQLAFLASFDALTGLPNRSHFLARCRDLVARATSGEGPLAVVVLALERLGHVRQTFGRETADALVHEVAQRLRRTVGPDHEAAALGGDELAIAWPCGDRSLDAEIERLCAVVAAPARIGDTDLHLRVVCGGVLVPDLATTTEEALVYAEAALLAARETGRSYAIYEDRLRRTAAERLLLEADLRSALAEDGLHLEFQPIFRLQGGLQPAFAEALVRWRHPVHGRLAPARFLPIAAEAGLSSDLDRWVLRRAMREHLELLQGSIEAISVNLTSASLDEPGLIADLEAAMEETGMPPRQLVIEVTEEAAMRDPERTIRVLSEIRVLGVRVALDDFGIAYSSLSYLHRLPADLLKLDRSFARGLGTVRRDERLVELVLSLADDYGLGVVAEGVERAEQLAWLTSRYCPYAQGFHLGRPQPAREVARWRDLPVKE